MLKNLSFLSALPAIFLLLFIPTEILADDGATVGQIAGDNAWMLTSTCLVLLMTIPGVALFYGGFYINACICRMLRCNSYLVYYWV